MYSLTLQLGDKPLGNLCIKLRANRLQDCLDISCAWVLLASKDRHQVGSTILHPHGCVGVVGAGKGSIKDCAVQLLLNSRPRLAKVPVTSLPCEFSRSCTAQSLID